MALDTPASPSVRPPRAGLGRARPAGPRRRGTGWPPPAPAAPWAADPPGRFPGSARPTGRPRPAEARRDGKPAIVGHHGGGEGTAGQRTGAVMPGRGGAQLEHGRLDGRPQTVQPGRGQAREHRRGAGDREGDGGHDRPVPRTQRGPVADADVDARAEPHEDPAGPGAFETAPRRPVVRVRRAEQGPASREQRTRVVGEQGHAAQSRGPVGGATGRPRRRWRAPDVGGPVQEPGALERPPPCDITARQNGGDVAGRRRITEGTGPGLRPRPGRSSRRRP